MKIAIIDDEKDARIVINSFVSKHISGNNTIFEADGVETGVELLTNTSVDLIFLDIQIEGGTGFDLLNRLQKINFKIIFTTAFDEYAIKAFRYAAIDYLLKPIGKDDFIDAIEKVTKSLSLANMSKRIQHLETIAGENAFNKLACPTQNGTKYIKVENIVHLESKGNYTLFYSANKERSMICRLLKVYEEILPESTFFRIHKSHIVHIKKIKEINHKDQTLLMTNGNVVPIARRRKEAFMEMIG